MRAQYAIVAEHVREGADLKVDILGLFDRIYAGAVPLQHPNMSFVALIVAESEDDFGKKRIRLTFKGPKGQVIFEHNGEFEIRPIAGTWLATARVVFNLAGLPIPDYGRYVFRLDIEGKQIASHLLSVVPISERPK